MTGTVLQSFCERCGTRYTFGDHDKHEEGGKSKLGRFKRRSNEDTPEGGSASTTLPSSDEFKGTFHFCLECRQYACADCWNAQEGHCVGCRPIGQTTKPGTDAQPPPTSGVAAAAVAPEPASGELSAAAAIEPGEWPSDDLERAATSAQDAASDSSHGEPASEDDGSSDDPVEPSDAPDTRNDDVVTSPWGTGIAPTVAGSDSSAPRSGADDAVTPVDEWGRVVKGAAPSAESHTGADVAAPATSAPVDPWRGVVFSGEGDEQEPASPLEQPASRAVFSPGGVTLESETSEPPPSQAADPSVDSSDAWPDSDKDTERAQDVVAGGPAWPDADRKGEADGEIDSSAVAAASGTEAPAADRGTTDPMPAASPPIQAATGSDAPAGIAPTDAAKPTAAVEPDEDGRTAAERILGVAAVASEAAVTPIGDSEPDATPAAATTASVAPEAVQKPAPGPEVSADARLTFVEPKAEPTPPPEATIGAAAEPVEPPATPAAPPRPLAEIPPAGPVPPPLLAQPATPGPFSEPFTGERGPQAPPLPPTVAAPAVMPPPSVPRQQTPPPAPAAMPPPPAPRQQTPVPAQAQPYPGPIVGAQGQPMMPPPALPSKPPAPAVKRTASQGCPSCGLPLSTKARFCRRCGAPQG